MTPLNADTVKALSARRGLTDRELASRADLSVSQLRRLISDPESAKIGEVKRVAGALGVSEYALYMPEERIQASGLPDFRRANEPIAELSSTTYKIIDSARELRSTVASFALDYGAPRVWELRGISSPATAAARARNILNLPFADQVGAKDVRAFYAHFRLSVESDNIFVLQDSYPSEDGSGLSLADGDLPPIVVINTKSATIGRRIFTLAHELYHVIRGDSGVSGLFANSSVERLCDDFASNFLLPEITFKKFLQEKFGGVGSYFSLIPRIAGMLKVSQQAVALRIDKLKLEPGLYRQWLGQFEDDNPDLSRGGGGGGRRDEDKIKLARYGFQFAKVFSKAIERGLISHFGLFELSGLRRDYSGSYFRYAKDIARTGATDDVFEEDA